MWSNEAYAEQTNAPAGGFAPAPHPGQYLPAQQLTPQPSAVAVAEPTSITPLGSLNEGAFDVPPTLSERIELCKFLCEANLLPQALRKAPANLLLIMHKAMALGIPLGVALEHMHVIDGKVGHSAELLRALLHRHGHVLRWISISDKEAVGELVLRHDPKNPRRETFSIAQAQRMQLTNKDNWKKDAESMLVARCSTRLVSRHCPEIAVALGNLSAVDLDDEPSTVRAEATPITDENTGPQAPTLAEQAAELLAETRAADNVGQVKEIGHRARQADLLNHVVEGDMTLQQVLLNRVQELSETPAEEDKPAAKPAKSKDR